MSILPACNCAWNNGYAPAHMVGHHANCPAWVPRPGALGSSKRAGRPTGGEHVTTGEWRNDAADRLHEALHTLGPRIPNLDVGDCHCNLLTQVVLDALSPNLAEASHWEYFAGLAFAYHDAPEGTDNVTVAWSELHEAIHHWRAQGGREPRDPDELATEWVRPTPCEHDDWDEPHPGVWVCDGCGQVRKQLCRP